MKHNKSFSLASLLALSLLPACGDSAVGNPDAGVPDLAAANPDLTVAPFGLDTRPKNTTCVAPARPPTGAPVMTQQAFGTLAFSLPIALLQAPGDDTRWFLVEKRGTVRTFANSQTPGTPTIFVDIVQRTNSGPNEAGLLGMAFHPKFAQNRQVFLSYTGYGGTTNLRSFISRFTSTDGGKTLDPNSEQKLVTIDQPYSNHNGGHIAFGPDGYLYIGMGDGGSGGDPQNFAQNTNSLLGKFLRIDVDNGTPYAIPSTNPFAKGGGRAEIYALGLRNPWRWSFDRATGELWCGDVGQNQWEEVDRIQLGGNYGWRFREGKHCYNPSTNCPTAGLIDPIVEYDHGQGVSITGGFVYRGTAIPGLVGRYVYGDFSSGRIWAVGYDQMTGAARADLLIDTSISISSFAEGNDGELYVLDYGTGRIHKLVPAGTMQDNFPKLLSQTGCVDPADATKPAAGLIPFDVNAPLWSDGADKQRYLALPDGAKIGVATDGDFDLPNGSVVVKNFSIAQKRVETRLFIRHADGGWAGYSYEWNDAGTDAALLPADKRKTVGNVTWYFPSRAQCLTCHTAAAGRTLGLEAGQLDGAITYPSTGRRANQLATLDHIGLFSAPLPTVPRLPAYDGPEPLASRARAYLHANCANCHRPGTSGQGPADFRFSTALAQTGTCDVAPQQGALGITNARIIAPGAPARSVVSARMRALDANRMPPLASSVVDAQGTALIDAWITALTTCN